MATWVQQPISLPLAGIDPLNTKAAQVWSQALSNQGSTPAIWISLGSSTANGGSADRDGGGPGVSTARGYGWLWRLNQRLTTSPLVVFSDDSYPGGALPGADYANWTRPANGVKIFNGAYGGQTSDNYLNNTRAAKIEAMQPQLITHMIGSNDWADNVSPATYYTNVRQWVARFVASLPNCHQVLFQQQGRWDVTGRSYGWGSYGAQLATIAAEFPGRVSFFDLSKYFQPLGIPPMATGSDLWNIAQANPEGSQTKVGQHLDEYGNRLMANFIAEYLGLPSDTLIGPESFNTRAFVSGSIGPGATKTIVTMDIPARPYYRAFELKGNFWATVNNLVSGGDLTQTQSEFQARLSNAVEGTAYIESVGPFRNPAPQNVTPIARYTLPPNTAATASILAAAYQQNTITIPSGNAYSQFTATTMPI